MTDSISKVHLPCTTKAWGRGHGVAAGQSH